MNAIASLIAVVVGWLSSYFGKRVVFAGALIAASSSLFLALAVAINALAMQLIVTLPGWAAQGAMFLPENTSGCLSALIVAKLARMVYDWQAQQMQIVAAAG